MKRQRWKGMGLFFLEAGACGKPVIAGRSGGVSNAVIDGVTGILVDPLNLEQIRNAITRLLTDENYARQLGTDGLRRIKENKLNLKNVTEKVAEALFES